VRAYEVNIEWILRDDADRLPLELRAYEVNIEWFLGDDADWLPLEFAISALHLSSFRVGCWNENQMTSLAI
jgi:hypothetical protein